MRDRRERRPKDHKNSWQSQEGNVSPLAEENSILPSDHMVAESFP